MKPRTTVYLTEDDLALMRRAAQEINSLRTGGANPEVLVQRLAELTSTIHYLIDCAGERGHGQ